MAAFNLTAQLNLQGPSNVRKIVSDIQKQVGTIKGTIDFTLDPGTTRNVTQLNSALKTLNATFITTNRTASSAASAIAQFNSAVNGINSRTFSSNLTASASAAQKLTAQQSRAAKAIDDSASSMQEFGKQSQLAIKRFVAYTAAAGPILAVANAARKGASAFIDFDAEVVKLQQVTGETAGGLKDLTSTISTLASGLGVSSSELVNVSSTLAQAGLSARDTEKALKALALSSLAPSFDNMNQTVEGSIALMRQFGIQASDLEGALGSVNAVAARFAVEAGDIIAAIQRTGGVFASASKGVSEGTSALNEFIAVFTSIRATTRESAETIATGLRTIFTRIQRGGTIDALKEYGVNLTDLDGKFVGAYKAVELLSKGLNQLDPRDIRFSKIVEELGGFRQIGKVIPLIQQFATAQEALAVAQQGQGSLTEDAAIAQLALANQISKVREEFLGLFRDIGSSDTFQTLAKGALQLTSALIGIADSVKGVLPVLALIGAVKGSQALVEFGYGFLGRSQNPKNPRNLASGGKVHYFAKGGSVPGYGSSDTIPAMLTPGEFVMSRGGVINAGRQNLEILNNGGRIQKFGRGSVGGVKSIYGPLPPNDPIVSWSTSNKTDLAHLGDLSPLSPQQLRNYLGRDIRKKGDPRFKATRSQKIDQSIPYAMKMANLNAEDIDLNDNSAQQIIDILGIGQKEPILVSLPSDTNQALRGGKQPKNVKERGVLKSQLAQWIATNPKTLLSPSKRRPLDAIKAQDIVVSPTEFASTLATFVNDLSPPSIVMDSDMASMRLPILNLLNKDAVQRISDRSDIIWKRLAPGGNKQDRHEGATRLYGGGTVQGFADGGIVQRKVGYIDYDVIANPANEAMVAKGMATTGVSGPRLYTDHLTQLAVKARKDSSLQKLRAIYGVAGAGKTTLARGQGTDKGALRETERFPVLTPEDIQKATEILVLSSSVSKDKLDNMFSATDKTYTLSSTTKEDKDRIKSQRGIRDTTGVGLEGRKPGSTSAVAMDTAVGEALLSDKLGDRSVVLGRTGSGQLRRKQGNELVEVIKKKIGFTWGGYSPMTAGHESIMDAAAAMGIPPEDFIYMVGSNEGITPGKEETYRTAIFDQDTRVLLAKAGAGARGATVLPKPRDFEVPLAFDLSEESQRRRVLVPTKGSSTFVADKTAQETEKYKTAGYNVQHIERTGGISGTMVRQLIKDGNLGELQKVLSPGVYDLISNNIGRIQNRANILPSLIQEVQQIQGTKLADVEQQIKALGITRIDNKKVASDPEYAAKVEVLKELREKRDQIKSSASFEPHRLIAALAAKEPEKYGLDLLSSMPVVTQSMRTMSSRQPQRVNIGGIIKRFNQGGVADEPTITLSQTSVADTARSNNISLQEAILQHLTDMQGIAGVRKIASISAGDRRISQVLRANSIREGRSIDEAAEYLDRALAARTSQQRDRAKAIQKSSQAGLLFGAAGVLGTPFAPIKKTVGAGILKSPTDVYVTSGTLQPDTALKLESILSNSIDKTTRRAAKRVMIDNILRQAGLGKILQLDFDRTLAFGADKIVSDDPKASQFAAFSDPQKIQEGLGNARLSSLGKELATLVANRPELLDNMRVVTARPQKTLDMVQSWLSSKGLPIPLSQFTGVGGPSVSGSQISKLKAAVLESNSVFVDDDKKNIREAIRAKKGITTFRYGLNAVKSDTNREGTTQGNMFERVIEALGGPKADKTMKGIDFPIGLKSAAKYFGIRGDIPTDAKRTLSGPSTVEKNIVSYLKAQGYKQGGSVGKVSRKVDFESGIGPSPFDIPKTNLDYYSLENISGFKGREFDELVKYAKTNDFSLEEFRAYLNKRAVEKQNRAGSVMDRKSLQSFLMHGAVGPRLGTGDLTEEQKKLADMLKSDRPDPKYNPDYDKKNFGGFIKSFNVGGYVPAMVSNGEAFIPPLEAQKIGYSTLNRMNQADRNGLGKFAGGSPGGIGVFKGPGNGTSDSIGPIALPVGSFILREAATNALGLSRRNGGPIGSIRSFAFGGSKGTPTLDTNRPDTVNVSTVAVSPETIQNVNSLIQTLGELGSVAKNSADVVRANGEVSYKVVAQALSKDIERLKLSGAGADRILAAEKLLLSVRQQGAEEVRKQRKLSDTFKGVSGRESGAVQQDILSQTETLAQNRIAKVEARMLADAKVEQQKQEAAAVTAKGGPLSKQEKSAIEAATIGQAKLSDDDKQKIYDRAAIKATASTTGVTKKDLKQSGVGGSDIIRYAQESMRDRKTLAQMDKQLITIKQDEMRNAVNFSRLTKTEQDRLLLQAKQAAEQEIKTRREIINQLAAEQGRAGVGGGKEPILGRFLNSISNPMVSLGVSTFGSLLGSGTPGSSGEAVNNAILQSTFSTFSQGLFAAGQAANAIPGPFGQVVAGGILLTTAVASIGSAFKDGRNAFIEFEQNFRSQKLQNTIEALNGSFAQLEKDVKNLDLRKEVSSQLITAGSDAQSLNSISDIPKAFWVNIFDAAFSSNQKEAANRSRILERFGTMPYLSSVGSEDSQRFFTRQLIPEQALANARSFSDVGMNTRRFIESRVDSGASLREIMDDADFAQFARNLAMANVEIQKQILSIQNSTSANKEAAQQAIITRYAESETVKIAQAASRRRSTEGLERETRSFSVSIQRVSQNMQDIINVINSNLTRFNEKVEYAVAAMSGQARSGQVSFGTLDVLKSPNAFSDTDRQLAADRAGSLFGRDQKLISSLLVLNKNLESSIMTAIDSTIANNPMSSDTKIGLSIDQAVQNTINQLDLPDAITKQLSKEIGLAVDRLRQSGKEKIDFEALKSEVPQLENILSSTRAAQEAALKSLENWQNQLNELTQAMNKSADLQISAADRRNQAEDIVINGTIELAKVLGRNFSAGIGNTLRDRRTARLAGGLTTPEDISNRLRSLTQLGQSQSASLSVQSERNVGNTGSLESIISNQKALRQTNNELRQTQQALKNLAENSEAASTALSSIQEAQQRQQGRVALIEKLVSSTPEELYKFNAAVARLQKLASGQTVRQTSEERRDTLSAFNDIAPLLGSSLEANSMRADILQSMLSDAGIGLTPQFQGILNALREPKTDPATQKAIEEYSKAIDIQSRANTELAKINTDLADQIADASARAIREALSQQVVKFDSAQLNDIARGLRSLATTTQNQPVPAVAKASGGMIYASEGMDVPTFAPRGTDTVPAMLTPGEFVVNRSATQRNLPLLTAINNGYSRGGKVSYYQDGGYVSSTLRDNFKERDNFRESKQSYLVLPEDIGEPEAVYTWNKLRSVATPTAADIQTKNINKSTNDTIQVNSTRKLGSSYTGFEATYSVNGELGGGWSFSPEGPLDQPMLRLLGSYYLNPRLLALEPSSATREKLIDQTDIPDRTEIGVYKDRLNKILQHLPSEASNSGQGIINIDGNKIIIEEQKFTGGAGRLSVDTFKQKVRVKNLAKPLGNDLSFGLYDQTSTSGQTHYDPDTVMDFAGYGDGRFLIGSAAQIEKKRGLSGYSFLRATGGSKASMTYNQSKLDVSKLPDLISALKASQEALDGEEFVTSDRNTNIDKQSQILGDIYAGMVSKEILEGAVASSDTKTPGQSQPYKFGTEFGNASKLTVYGMPIDEWTRNIPGLMESSYLQRFKEYITDNELGADIKYWDPNGKYSTPFDIAPRNDPKSKKLFPWVAGVAPDIKDIDAELKKKADEKKSQAYGQYGASNVKGSQFKFNKLPSIPVPYSISYQSIKNPKKYDKASGRYTNEDLLPIQQAEIIQPDNLFENATMTAFTDTAGAGEYAGSLGYAASLVEKFVNQSDDFNKYFEQIQKPGFSLSEDKSSAELKQLRSRLSSANIRLSGNQNPLFGFLTGVKSSSTQYTGYDTGSRTLKIGDTLLRLINEAVSQKRGRLSNQRYSSKPQDPENKPNFKLTDYAALSQGLIYSAYDLFGAGKTYELPNSLGRGWFSPRISKKYNSIFEIAPELIQDYMKQMAAVLGNQYAVLNTSLSRLQGTPEYDKALEALNLLSGAQQAFFMVGDGDTSKLGTFLDRKLFEDKIFDQTEKEAIVAAFKNLGTSGADSRIRGRLTDRMSEDEKVDWARQLSGSRINDPNLANSSVKPFDEIGGPQTFGDLFDLGINPYNQFSTRAIRQAILDRFLGKIDTARDKEGRPLFSASGGKEFADALSSLKLWYGGDQQDIWKGLDYLYDKTVVDANKIPLSYVDRWKELEAFDEKDDLYDKAGKAHSLVGGREKFGELPPLEFFKDRGDDVQYRRTGGIIYASQGSLVNFEPRGTDTVPAMLTPGEFVVNRTATQKHLPLLQAINDGAKGYSQGGIVYLSSGGLTPAQENRFNQLNSMSSRSRDEENEYTELKNKRASSSVAGDTKSQDIEQSRRAAVRERNQRMALMAIPPAQRSPEQQERYNALIAKRDKDRPEIAQRNANYRASQAYNAEAARRSNERLVNQYAEEYKSSGSALSPEEWAAQNKPGMRGQRLDGFLAKVSGSDYDYGNKMTDQQFADAGTANRARLDAVTNKKAEKYTSDKPSTSSEPSDAGSKPMLPPSETGTETESSEPSIPAPPPPAPVEPTKPAPAPAPVEPPKPAPAPAPVEPPKPAPAPRVPAPARATGGENFDPFAERPTPSPAETARTKAAERQTETNDQQAAARQERKDLRRAAAQQREDIIAETRRRLEMTISREEATIKDKTKNREESGWWAASMRGMGLMSDPYEAEMEISRQRVTAAKMGLAELKAATVDVSPSGYVRDTFKIDNFNTARRLAGLDEVSTGVDAAGNMTVSRVEKTETEKANDAARRAADTSYSQQLLDNEQSQITAARDISIDSVLAVGGVATGVAGMATRGGTMALQQAGKTGLRQVAKTAALEGAAEGLAGGTTRAIDDVTRGAKTTQEGISSALLESAIGGGIGSILGPMFSVGIPAAGRALSSAGSLIGDIASPITKPISRVMSSVSESVSRGMSDLSDYLDLPTQSRYSALMPSNPAQARQYRALVAANRGPREAIEEMGEILRTGSDPDAKAEEAFAKWTAKNIFDFVGMQPGSLVNRFSSNPLDNIFDFNSLRYGRDNRSLGSLSELAGVDQYRPTQGLSVTSSEPKIRVNAAQVTEYQRLIDTGMDPASAKQRVLTQTSEVINESAVTPLVNMTTNDIRPLLRGPMSLPTGKLGEYRYNPGLSSQNAQGIAGWKASLKAAGSTPDEFVKNNQAIEKWLIENSNAEFKNFDDAAGMFWRAETLGGSEKEMADLAAKMYKDIGNILDPSFVYQDDPLSQVLAREFAPGIRARFDSMAAVDSVAPDVAKSFRQAMSGPMPDGVNLPFYAQPDAVLNNANAGQAVSGAWYKKIEAIKNKLQQSTDPLEITRLQQAVVDEETNLQNILTKTFPDIYSGGQPLAQAAETPSGIMSKVRGLYDANKGSIPLSATEQSALAQDAIDRLRTIELDTDYVPSSVSSNRRGEFKLNIPRGIEGQTGLYSGTMTLGKKANAETRIHEQLHAVAGILGQLDNITGGNIAPEVLDMMAKKLELNPKSLEIMAKNSGQSTGSAGIRFNSESNYSQMSNRLIDSFVLPESLRGADLNTAQAMQTLNEFIEEYKVAQALKFGEKIENPALGSLERTRKALTQRLSEFAAAGDNSAISQMRDSLSEVIPVDQLDSLLSSDAKPITSNQIFKSTSDSPIPKNSGIMDKVLSALQLPSDIAGLGANKLLQQPKIKEFLENFATKNQGSAEIITSIKDKMNSPLVKALTGASIITYIGSSVLGSLTAGSGAADEPKVVEARTISRSQNGDPYNPPKYLYPDGKPVPEDEQPKDAQKLYKGGVVYANNGALIASPRGTDSVPAMLTPGEFVVNRQATAHNMTLLHAINSGHYTHGGLIKYLSNGGVVQPKYLMNGSQNPVNSINNQVSSSGVLSNRVSQNTVSTQPQGASLGIDLSKMEQMLSRFEQAMVSSANTIKDGGTIDHKISGEVKTQYDQKTIRDIIGQSVGVSDANTSAQVNNAQAATNKKLFNGTDGAIS